MKTITNFILEKLSIRNQEKIKGLSLDDIRSNVANTKITYKDVYNVFDTNPQYSLHFYITVDSNSTYEVTDFSIVQPNNRDILKENVTLLKYNLANNEFLIYLSNNNESFDVDYISSKNYAGDIIDDVNEDDYKKVVICYNQFTITGMTNWKALYYIYNIDVDNHTKTITLYLTDERFLKSLLTKQALTNDDTVIAIPELFDKHNEKTLYNELDKDKSTEHGNIPDKYKYHKNGESTLFWKVYNTLLLYGPMTKIEVLETINKILDTDLKSTSYATSFAQWTRNNQIASVNRKLEAQPYSKWKV